MTDHSSAIDAVAAAATNWNPMRLGKRTSRALAAHIVARLASAGFEVRPVDVTVPESPATLFGEGVEWSCD